MSFRRRAHKRSDKRYFSRTAGNTHSNNLRSNPKRGGYRL